MSFPRYTLVGVGGIAAVLLYQLGNDERVAEMARSVPRAIQDMGAKAQAAQEGAEVIKGAARVVDGKSLEFLARRVHVELAGIDTCDRAQIAYLDTTPWPCGTVATAWLVSQTLGETVECELLSRRVDGRYDARCGVNGADIAAEALIAGQALLKHTGDPRVPLTTYRQLEGQARAQKIGIWSSTFTPPDQWREDRVNDQSSQIRQINPRQQGAGAP